MGHAHPGFTQGAHFRGRAFQWEAPAPRMWEGRWIRPREQSPSLVAWQSRSSLSRRRVSQGQVGSDNPPERVRAPCQEVFVPVDWWRKEVEGPSIALAQRRLRKAGVWKAADTENTPGCSSSVKAMLRSGEDATAALFCSSQCCLGCMHMGTTERLSLWDTIHSPPPIRKRHFRGRLLTGA